MTQTTTITREAIREQARIVAKAREDAQHAKDYLSTSRQLWEEQNANFIRVDKELQGLQAIAESQLRDLALKYYADTQDKHPGSGVEIKVEKHFSYTPAEAFGWAMEHKMALNLNVKLFESIAKTTPISFVRSTDEPTATIAQDLEKALAEGVEKENHE